MTHTTLERPSETRMVGGIALRSPSLSPRSVIQVQAPSGPVGQCRQFTLLLVTIVALGLALRGYHYFNDPPVWHDEAAQIYNVLHKSYGEAFGPLFYSEACPPLFLMAEKAIVEVFGDSSLALRLLPFLASCVAYLALVLLARMVVPPVSVLWFALLMGCSDRLLWHTCEAKPYALDARVAAVVLGLGLGFQAHTKGGGSGAKWLALAVLGSPILIFVSFPSCFLLGGLLLVLALSVWRSRSAKTRLLYVSFGVALCASFAVLYFTAIQAQKNERMLWCWQEMLPPWDRPWLVPAMSVVRVTEAFRYAAEPVGNVLTLFAIVGGVCLWRRGQSILVGLLIWPIGLNLVAWLMSSYPLAATRVVVYLAPALLLLVAAGIPPMLAWIAPRSRWAFLMVIVLLLVPVGQTMRVLVMPWNRHDAATPAAFVLQHRTAGEPVVGTRWEHAYYFRELGDDYRALTTLPTEPASLTPTAATTTGLKEAGYSTATSLWLASSINQTEQEGQLALLTLGGRWHIVEQIRFRDVVVLRLRQTPQ